jgi:hypothetical protein
MLKMTKKTLMAVLLILLMLATPLAFAQEDTTIKVNAGISPDNPFYFLDRLGEDISITFTFNKQTKAQKYLNYAQERTSELSLLKDSEKIESLQENFDNNLLKASDNTVSLDGSELIQKTKEFHIAKLNELKDRLPESAQEGIDIAINNANKFEERVKNRLSQVDNIKNQELIKERLEQEFEGNTFHMKVNTGDLVEQPYDLEDIEMYSHSYYIFQDGELVEIETTDADYTITINDQDQALELSNKYNNGEELTYDEITDVIDIPFSLKSKLMAIIGLEELR